MTFPPNSTATQTFEVTIIGNNIHDGDREFVVFLTNPENATVGIPGAGTFLPLMLSEGVNKGRISLEKLVDVCCFAPAKEFGLAPDKGIISIGSDADLVLIDLKKESVVPEDPVYSGSDLSPFEGWKIKGWPILTMLRGSVVAKDGKIVGKRGYGRFISAR